MEWVHAVAAIIAVLLSSAGTIFACGRWVGRSEERLKTEIAEARIEIEDKVDSATKAFDETLKGLRQKINDVELHAERRFLPRDDFNEFRDEYREDMRDLKAMIRNGHS